MKNPFKIVEILFCTFLAVFAIEPLFANTAYETFVSLYAVLALAVFWGLSAVSAFLKLKWEFVAKMMTTKTTIIEGLISACGIAIAWICGSQMYKFWTFMLVVSIISVLISTKKKI